MCGNTLTPPSEEIPSPWLAPPSPAPEQPQQGKETDRAFADTALLELASGEAAIPPSGEHPLAFAFTIPGSYLKLSVAPHGTGLMSGESGRRSRPTESSASAAPLPRAAHKVR